MRYCEYDATNQIPNVVVDGSPNAATVLTLSHWPGTIVPSGLRADLSAQISFLFAASGDAVGAEVVTNNHFDQDGLVAMFALVDPEAARQHRELLIDVAAAGDFATYRYRQAARASMAIAAYADPERSPIASQLAGPYGAQCAALYETMLECVLDLVVHPERFEELWADEDDELTHSEAALASGSIVVHERPGSDLAVVEIAAEEPQRSGHRFASDEYVGAHPLAINNATGCFRILVVHGRRYAYTDRYETWVQYRSRRPLPRVDLRPLAEELSAADPHAVWTATAPSVLSPRLATDGESGLDPTTVLDHLTRHLASAPPAWDPYAGAG